MRLVEFHNLTTGRRVAVNPALVITARELPGEPGVELRLMPEAAELIVGGDLASVERAIEDAFEVRLDAPVITRTLGR